MTQLQKAFAQYQGKLKLKQRELFCALVELYNRNPLDFLTPSQAQSVLKTAPSTVASRLRDSLARLQKDTSPEFVLSVTTEQYRLVVQTSEVTSQNLSTAVAAGPVVPAMDEAKAFWQPHLDRPGPIAMRHTEALLFRQPETRVMIRFLDYNGYERIDDLIKDKPYLKATKVPGELVMRVFHLPPESEAAERTAAKSAGWKESRRRSTRIKAFPLRQFRHFVSAGEVEFLLKWGPTLVGLGKIVEYGASHRSPSNAVSPGGSIISIGNSRTSELVRQILGWFGAPNLNTAYSFDRLPFRMDPTGVIRAGSEAAKAESAQRWDDFEKAKECFNLYGIVTRTTMPGGEIPLTIIAANHGSMLAAISRYLDSASDLASLRNSFGGIYPKEFQVLLTAPISSFDEELVGEGVARRVSIFPVGRKGAAASL